MRLFHHHHSRRDQPALSGLEDIGQQTGDDHGLKLRYDPSHIDNCRPPRPEQLVAWRRRTGEEPQLQERLQLAHQIPLHLGVAPHHLLYDILQGVGIRLRSQGADGLIEQSQLAAAAALIGNHLRHLSCREVQ